MKNVFTVLLGMEKAMGEGLNLFVIIGILGHLFGQIEAWALLLVVFTTIFFKILFFIARKQNEKTSVKEKCAYLTVSNVKKQLEKLNQDAEVIVYHDGIDYVFKVNGICRDADSKNKVMIVCDG